MKEFSDAALLSAYFAKGCEDSFREIVFRYGGLTRSTAARILGVGPDAEDAAQAAFIALAMKGRKVDASRGLGAWLHRVTQRSALDIQKSFARRKIREEEAVERDVPGKKDSVLQEMDRAIGELPEKLRRTIVAHYLEGRSVEEIANGENCSASAISMRLTRAREVLKRRLGAASVAALGLLMASRSSLEAVETTLSTIRILSIARSSAGLPLAAVAKSALRPTWREFSGSLLAGAGFAVVLIGAAFSLSHSSASDQHLVSHRRPAPTPSQHVRMPSPVPAVVDHPLIQAIKRNPPWDDSRSFTNVLDQYRDGINTIRDANGLTALHWALKKNAENFASLLLLRGADPDLQDFAGHTPVWYAVDSKSTWSLFSLILRGANINKADSSGCSPLACAVEAHDLRHAEILLWAGADPSTAGPASGEMAALLADYSHPGMPLAAVASSGPPEFVKNPVHVAARRGDFPMLEKMLTQGPGVNVRDENGRTPLHEAIAAAQPEVVFYLLMMGADVNALDDKGESPFGATMGWFGGGLDAMRRFLLIRGANPRAVRNDGHTETTWAVLRDNEHGLQWLLWMGVDARQRTRHGTPFEIAVKEGNQRIIDILRRNGVDGPTRLSDDPIWLLHNGAKRGDITFLDEALDAGAPVDQPDENGNSALMLSIYKRNVATARHLLARGASLDFINEKNGGTPLYATMGWDYGEMTDFRRELLEAGADPNIHVKSGLTPLMRALWHTPGTPLKQLIEYGADLNARDAQGRTILRRAMDEGKMETADFLRLQGAAE